MLFWAPVGARQIGTDAKDEKVPRWLIVDGQQRLTSLYAVLTGHPIVRDDYTEARLRLAFNPLGGKFEVADAAIERDPEFLADVTPIWSDYRATVRSYIERLEASRGPLAGELEERVEERFDRLRNLNSYPFEVVELDAEMDEEQVADVFVRINSEGVPLNRADFILTLMSVFQESSRGELEEFARAAKRPQSKPGPFNWFIQPQPDQLLRVSVALAFRRAVLRHAYSLLRGKDLETGEVSSEKRDMQFARLQKAQSQVLNLTNWQEFLQCIERAGFRGSKMISGQNALLYSYALWLIGRVDHGVSLPVLRDVIARWFFMAHTTSHYSGAFETRFEADVARLSDLPSNDPAGFVEALNRMIDDTLTSDYWTITLPNDLSTSAAKSPALIAYIASLNILDADVLLSDTKVRSRLDPAITLKKGIERHHLFPRGYLRGKLGTSDVRSINQIANYALVEWSDNIAISDSAPSDYWPQQLAEKDLASGQLGAHRYWHALPEGWETMPYDEFLATRRQMMARVVRDAFAKLTDAGYEPEMQQAAIAADHVLAAEESLVGVRFRDLIDADVLPAGASLLPSGGELGPVATVLPDGNVYMDGEAFDSPSEAATRAAGRAYKRMGILERRLAGGSSTASCTPRRVPGQRCRRRLSWGLARHPQQESAEYTDGRGGHGRSRSSLPCPDFSGPHEALGCWKVTVQRGIPEEPAEGLTIETGGGEMTDWESCPAVESVPGRVSGASTFTGTRVPVSALFENLASGATVEEFLDWFPGVEEWQVRAVLDHEAKALRTPA